MARPTDYSDADRWRWLSTLDACSFHLSKDDDHTVNYMTAREWIEECSPEDFTEVDPALVHEMKDTNTIWRLQLYPDTPVGFYVFYGPSMKSVVDQAIKADIKRGD